MTRIRLQRLPIRGFLPLLVAGLTGVVAFPATPAAASTTHRLTVQAALDIKDDDVGEDDWCRNLEVDGEATVDHVGSVFGHVQGSWRCDEVRIEWVIRGQLMSDERICNVSVDLNLYEGQSRHDSITDLDGTTYWRGQMRTCIARNGSLTWDVMRVDNTAEDEPDHGWMRNFRIANVA